ncbi:hypothetical protein SCHPADRAFT_890789 [Schizopora paradoxa]|uniref:Uncharacterized protein n=1 Tax=Schizopora paradoxa TaxID=27342 RepID=A0A0H2S6M8_9AGAM|nr:hypothetical protein SCHPADRAFT_890789 [Schizopora paradoxa]
MTIPALQTGVNATQKFQEFDRFFVDCQSRDDVLKFFLCNVRANNTSFTILELKSLVPIEALYGLAVGVLEMYRVLTQLCGPNILNPRNLYPLLTSGGIPYRNMWTKILTAANILMERQKQSGDFQSNIRLSFIQDSETIIFWISKGMEVAQKISMAVKE